MSTETDPRRRIQRAIYTTTPPTILGLDCRPYTAGVFDLCGSLGLKILHGTAEERAAMNARDRNRELLAIFFLLSQPEDVVLDAVASGEKFWSDWLPPFALGVPMASLGEVSDYLVAVATQAADSATKVVPKPSDPDAPAAPTPPKNS